MRALLILIVVFLVLSLGLSRQVVPDAVLDARHAAVSIVRKNLSSGEYERYCSGAVVEGYVYTAGHCIRGTGQMYIEDQAGRRYRVSVVEHVNGWPENDYAVLKSVYTATVPNLKRGGELELGREYYAWTGPDGFELLLHRGIYSGIIRPNVTQSLRSAGMGYLTINAIGGASGSVVLDSEGNAVAIIVGGFVAGPYAAALTGAIVAPLPPEVE